MQLSQLVSQALQSGRISTELKSEIERICDPELNLSAEEEFYLDRLMGAMLTGEISGFDMIEAIAS